jgi:hypothetical protein
MARFLIGLAAVWIFGSGFGSGGTSACGDSQRDCKPCKRPDGSLNHSPNVTALNIDKLQIRLKDPQPGPPPEETPRFPELMVNVATNAVDAENDVLDYYYVVSAGRIVGSGSNVQWDLNGVPPGTYTITARVDDSCGICGKTVTQAVVLIGKMPVVAATPAPIPATRPTTNATKTTTATTTNTPTTTPKSTRSLVIERPTPTPASTYRARVSAPNSTATTSPVAVNVPASCPKVLITDPERVGDELIFTTKIFDLMTAGKLTYIWTVVGGNVVSQDKATVHVKPGVLGGSIKVSVNGFDRTGTCPNSAEKTF